jgi:hypothetical protein
MADAPCRFGIDSLALHWYVWDDIAFDTGYPDYFPAKPGFPAAVQTLQSAGVHVVPYINGRIFDVGTPSWKADGASQFAAQAVPLVLNPSTYSLYEEACGAPRVAAASVSLWAVVRVRSDVCGDVSAHGVLAGQDRGHDRLADPELLGRRRVHRPGARCEPARPTLGC